MNQINTAKVGTTTEKTMKFRKAGIHCVYEVYETACGGIFTARLKKYANQNVNGPWSDPADTAEDACRKAYSKWYAPIKAAKERSDEYYRTGGY